MSWAIDETRPYTDEEKEWLLTRANGKALIEVNDRKFGDLSKRKAEAERKQAEQDRKDQEAMEEAARKEQEELEASSYHPDDLAQVQNLTIRSLREKAKKMNLDSTGTGNDVAIRILDYLDDQRNPVEEPDKEDSPVVEEE